MARVVSEGIEAAAHDEAVARESAARASAVLRTSVAVPEEVRKMAAHGGRHYRPLRNELIGPAAEDAEQVARDGRHRRTLHPPVVINEDVRVLPGSPQGRHYNGE
jgi:hypothetical protein